MQISSLNDKNKFDCFTHPLDSIVQEEWIQNVFSLTWNKAKNIFYK